jgi:hypothetical protein
MHNIELKRQWRDEEYLFVLHCLGSKKRRDMNTTHQKDARQSRSGMNPIVVGAVSAAVGATVTWFSDAKNRKKASQVLEETISRARSSAEDAKKIAADAIKEMEGHVDDTVQKGKKIAKNKLPEMRDAAEAVKDTAERATKKTEQKDKELK